MVYQRKAVMHTVIEPRRRPDEAKTLHNHQRVGAYRAFALFDARSR